MKKGERGSMNWESNLGSESEVHDRFMTFFFFV